MLVLCYFLSGIAIRTLCHQTLNDDIFVGILSFCPYSIELCFVVAVAVNSFGK